MEIRLTADTEIQLPQLAASQGKNSSQVVEEAVTRILHQVELIEGVRRAMNAARRGDVISHDEVKSRINRRAPDNPRKSNGLVN